MIFVGTNNQTVELRIEGYQYPKNFNNDIDSNWLNIYLEVRSNVGNWQTVNPILSTLDVQSLIDWFDTISQDKEPAFLNLEFTEPNLAFELLTDCTTTPKTFRIRFDLESRPTSATDDKEYFVDVIAENTELEQIGAVLKKELDLYPVRKLSHNHRLQKAQPTWWQKLFGFKHN